MYLVVIIGIHHVIVLFREVTLLKHGINVSIIIKVIAVGYFLSYIKRSRETLYKLAELTCIRIMCYEFCHILERKHYLIKLLDETIATLYVLLAYVHAIDDGITRLTVNLAIEKEIDVGVLEMVVVDEILNEMNHWSRGHILHKDYILAICKLCPA